MRKIFRVSITLLTAVVILLLISAFFSQSVFVTLKGTDKSGSDEGIKQAYEYIGEKGPTWKSLVLSSSAETNIDRDTIWKYWGRLEDWNKWQGHLVNSAKWKSDSTWKTGAEFEQELNLGFPIGKRRESEIVGDARTGSEAAWWKNEGGIRTFHVWLFEKLPGGRSRVTNTVVYHGPLVGLTKIFYGKILFGKIEKSVEGLLEYARRMSR